MTTSDSSWLSLISSKSDILIHVFRNEPALLFFIVTLRAPDPPLLPTYPVSVIVAPSKRQSGDEGDGDVKLSLSKSWGGGVRVQGRCRREEADWGVKLIGSSAGNIAYHMFCIEETGARRL